MTREEVEKACRGNVWLVYNGTALVTAMAHTSNSRFCQVGSSKGVWWERVELLRIATAKDLVELDND